MSYLCNMTAGRPLNSKTPLWNNKAAIKVRIYRWMYPDGTRYGCAKTMAMSRTTVIKWWDSMAWSEQQRQAFNKVWSWMVPHDSQDDCHQCADELGMTLEDVLLDVATIQEMTPRYVIL